MKRATVGEPRGLLEDQLRAQIKAMWITIVMLAVAAVVTITVLVVFGVLTRNKLNGQESALRIHGLHACEIDNVTRALENKSEHADYGVFLFVQKRFSIPTPTETPAQKAITSQFTSTLRASLQAKTWATLTNCTAAHGSLGIETFPIAQGPPPASQMSVANAARPNPVGSTP